VELRDATDFTYEVKDCSCGEGPNYDPETRTIFLTYGTTGEQYNFGNSSEPWLRKPLNFDDFLFHEFGHAHRHHFGAPIL